MKKNIFKLIVFLFLGLTLLVLIPGIVLAINTVSTGWRVNHGTVADVTNSAGSCFRITNNSSHDYFIPTKTSAEWNAFYNHKPANVTSSSTCPCVPNCVGLDCGDNGCGGSCGTCTGSCDPIACPQAWESCYSGHCGCGSCVY